MVENFSKSDDAGDTSAFYVFFLDARNILKKVDLTLRPVSYVKNVRERMMSELSKEQIAKIDALLNRFDDARKGFPLAQSCNDLRRMCIETSACWNIDHLNMLRKDDENVKALCAKPAWYLHKLEKTARGEKLKAVKEVLNFLDDCVRNLVDGLSICEFEELIKLDLKQNQLRSVSSRATLS